MDFANGIFDIKQCENFTTCLNAIAFIKTVKIFKIIFSVKPLSLEIFDELSKRMGEPLPK